MSRNKQINYYKSILRENEILLLKSQDSFFRNHYTGSPLNILTNFAGTAGEAIIDSTGKIRLFVDTRYHLLVEKQAFDDIEIYKMKLDDNFFDVIQKEYKKGTKLYVSGDIPLKDYLKLDKHFDLRTYMPDKKYLKNNDLNIKAPVFEVDKKIEINDFSFKVNKLKELSSNIDKMIVFNLDEISYLTNLRSFQMMHCSNFRSYLYLDFKNKNYILFLDKIPNKIKIENLEFKKIDEFVGFINSVETDIYIDTSYISLENFLAVKKPKNITNKSLSLISSIKSQSVIEHLLNSSKKLDLAISKFKNKLKEGLSEKDLVKIFEDELINTGAICPSFKTLLPINKNTASIHYSTYDENQKISQESLILLDCGGYYEAGYATDITRTFYFGNNPKPIYKKIYTAVLKAYIACFCSQETNAQKLDNLAREKLKPYEDDGFYFNHGLGHGIGTSVHQNPPLLALNSNDIIQPYQTHSIEPGLYGKDKTTGLEFGVRIENCVYFDLNYKRHALTHYPLEEILIDYNMLNEDEKCFIKNMQESK